MIDRSIQYGGIWWHYNNIGIQTEKNNFLIILKIVILLKPFSQLVNVH